MQTISGRIFELLKEQNMSQKTFAQKTGIAESTISDWKKKRNNRCQALLNIYKQKNTYLL